METCEIKNFLEILTPWLDRDYVRKIFVTRQDQLVLFFSDGGQRDYRIDDCSKEQLADILRDLQQKGIPVETER